MYTKRSLEQLEEQRERVGPIGALDFLIEYERSKGAPPPDRLERLRRAAAGGPVSTTADIEKGLPSATSITPTAQKKTDVAKPKLRNKVSILRTKLLSLGFTDEPLAELEQIALEGQRNFDRVQAAQAIALWHLRINTVESCKLALKYIEIALRHAGPNKRIELIIAKLHCYRTLGYKKKARKLFDSLEKKNQVTADIWLTWTNFENDENERLRCINKALTMYGAPQVSLISGHGGIPPYDRLNAAEHIEPVYSGPKVTVLVAAYDCPDTLPTCLRSLEQQSWRSLEVIVLDDCSPTSETFEIAQEWENKDGRFTAIRMKENGGAYVARNYGLSLATGKYVTLHDADDWSHPLKIEQQVRYLEDHPDIIATFSKTFRTNNDLVCTRWVGNGKKVLKNTSSFMFHRKPILQHVGYWDRVRFSADSELIDRVEMHFGSDAVVELKGSVYSIQRDSNTSMIRNEILGIRQMPHGVRRQYKESHKISHQTGYIKYERNPKTRPFPVPRCMLKNTIELKKPEQFDVIIASDYRMRGGSVNSCAEEIRCQTRAGLKTAILPMYRYDLTGAINIPILPIVWDQVDGKQVHVLAPGDNVRCDLLIIRYPPVLYQRLRLFPNVEAKEIRVIVNQSPMSDYGPEGVVRYSIKECAKNLDYYFGRAAVWHPIGPQVRDVLNSRHLDELKHISVADWDWSNIIDLESWGRGHYKPLQDGKLKIGRHSRDGFHKWPSDKETLLKVYPNNKDIEVHILGGAKRPKEILGEIPENWVVHDFNSIEPKNFLKHIDVFVYFTYEHWVESFGRVIIEAMAAGVPVILPKIYQPLFGEAALYAEPEAVVDIARKLCEDPGAYREQVSKAQRYIHQHFSYDTHLKRLDLLGVNVPFIPYELV